MTTAFATYMGVESDSRDDALAKLDSLRTDASGICVAVDNLENAIRAGVPTDGPLQALVDACVDFTSEGEEIEYLLLDAEN